MKERFEDAFNDILAENRKGEIRNLLITDNNAEFLDDAIFALHSWATKNGMNLVELDGRDSSWVPKIQSRELFCKLNQPNTVLLIKNYATVSCMRRDNTSEIFLQNAVKNRNYTCGIDFKTSKLPNLMFVVVINDLAEMTWGKDEYMTFSIIHQDDTKKVWTNKNIIFVSSRMYPVMSAANKVKFSVSDDETSLCLDIGEVFRGVRLRHPIADRRPTMEYKLEMIHTYIESNLPEFNEHVNCLILKMGRFGDDEHFIIDGIRLKKSFPNLGTICCKDNIKISDIDDDVCILDPFDIGEMCFNLAQDGDVALANTFVRDLWALDIKWARFFNEVAKDYYRWTEDNAEGDSDSNCSGMDHLFHIYLLGWYHTGDDLLCDKDKVYVSKHKNIDKALDLLPVRFKNCSVDEVANKLYLDFKHIDNDDHAEYHNFSKILSETERLFPGVKAKMCEKGNFNEDPAKII